MHKEQLEPNGQQNYIEQMNSLRNERLGSDTTIVDPWSPRISSIERAQTHMRLLDATYGHGHPGSAQNLQEIIDRQQEGTLLTWIVNWQDMPVGMVNFEIQDNIAEAVRSVALPRGTILSDGNTYSGQANVSAAMYQRIPDLLAHPDLKHKIFAIEGDVRLAKEIILPNQDVLPSGVRTQHINKLSGLDPYLLVVPRYQVHPEGGSPHQEAFLQSRLYLNRQNVHMDETIYTPLVHPRGKLTVADIARAAFQNAHGLSPDVSDYQSVTAPAELSLEATAGIHFSTVRANGDVSEGELVNTLRAGLNQSRFVEIIIPNRMENIELQRRLLEFPVVSLGAFPGGVSVDTDGRLKHTETTLHFGITSPEIARQIVEVECAKDYDGSRLQELVHQLREEWRELAA